MIIFNCLSRRSPIRLLSATSTAPTGTPLDNNWIGNPAPMRPVFANPVPNRTSQHAFANPLLLRHRTTAASQRANTDAMLAPYITTGLHLDTVVMWAFVPIAARVHPATCVVVLVEHPVATAAVVRPFRRRRARDAEQHRHGYKKPNKYCPDHWIFPLATQCPCCQ